MHATRTALVLKALLVLAPLLSAAATTAVAQSSARTQPIDESASEFRVSEKDRLISVRAVHIELARVVSELSRVSGLSIEILDQAGGGEPVTVSFHDKTVKAAVTEVMAALSPGAISFASGTNGPNPAIYVLTKDGVDAFRIDMLAMIASARADTLPEPEALRGRLLHVSPIGFALDPAGMSAAIGPVLQLIDQHYALYEPMVASLFRDSSVNSPLRSAMLDIIERHWNFPTSRDHLLTVFSQAADDRVLHARIARTLASRGENVADELMTAYRTDPPEAKAYYAEALAAAGKADALPLLREDAMGGQDFRLRCASVAAVIKLDPASADTHNLVENVIHATRPLEPYQRSASDLDNERLAMRAVVAIGQSADAPARQRLLSIARDDSVAIDVRLTALESLAALAKALPEPAKAALYHEMASLGLQVTDSPNLSEVSRERMLGRIRMIQKRTAAE